MRCYAAFSACLRCGQGRDSPFVCEVRLAEVGKCQGLAANVQKDRLKAKPVVDLFRVEVRQVAGASGTQ